MSSEKWINVGRWFSKWQQQHKQPVVNIWVKWPVRLRQGQRTHAPLSQRAPLPLTKARYNAMMLMMYPHYLHSSKRRPLFALASCWYPVSDDYSRQTVIPTVVGQCTSGTSTSSIIPLRPVQLSSATSVCSSFVHLFDTTGLVQDDLFLDSIIIHQLCHWLRMRSNPLKGRWLVLITIPDLLFCIQATTWNDNLNRI